MRRMLAAMIAGLLALSLAPATAANEWEPTTAGGWVSGPVEHLSTILKEAGTAVDAVVHDGYLYVTTWRSFSIYDISDPRNPARLGHQRLVAATFNEEPQTNGEVLLISRDTQWTIGALPRVGGVLEIYDVTDKANPEHVGTYESHDGPDHLWTCVLDCTYAYSATGTIVDLRDPTAPKEVGDWSEVAPYDGWHHIAEVAPGLVLTGTTPMFVLDATDDPAAPTVLAEVEVPVTDPGITLSANPHALPARVAWPRQGRDRYAVVSMETPFNGRCHEPAGVEESGEVLTNESGEVLTFDTAGWRGTGTFEHVDRFQLADNGIYADGNAPHNVFGCSAYGMDTHPAWGRGDRLAAVTFFEHGIRLLAVDHAGALDEVGGFIPAAGNSAAVRWLDGDVLAVIDLHRGIDLFHVDLDAIG